MKKTILILLMIFLLSAGADAAIFNDNSYGTSATGTTGDSAATNSTSSWSIIALLKGLYALGASGVTGLAANQVNSTVSNGSAIAVETRTDGAQVVAINSTPEQQYNGFSTLSSNAETGVFNASTAKRLGLYMFEFDNLDSVTHCIKVRPASGATQYVRLCAVAGAQAYMPLYSPWWTGINNSFTAQLDANPTTTSPVVSGEAYWIGAQ